MLTASTRLLRLLSLLQTRSHWAGPELAGRLEITPRTLRRDIDRLRQLGYPIHASTGVAGGYTFRPGRALPPLLLSDDEALAAATALRTATSGAVGGIEEPALRALVKLEQVMPARLRRRVHALRSAITSLDRVGPVVDVTVLAGLAAACREQLRVSYDYGDIRGKITTRTVEPQGVVHTGSRWYLVAWDPSRNDWRTFRIDRISGSLKVGAHFAPRASPERGDLRAFVSRSTAVQPYPERARVILHAPHAAMSKRIPPTAGTLEAIDDQRCLLQCGAQVLDSIVYWLLALDIEFEVLEPPQLIERMRAASERLSRYLNRRPGAPA